jgi:hypothetical protein
VEVVELLQVENRAVVKVTEAAVRAAVIG